MPLLHNGITRWTFNSEVVCSNLIWGKIFPRSLYSFKTFSDISTFGDPLDRRVYGKGFLNQDFTFMQTYTMNFLGSLTSRSSYERYPINPFGTTYKAIEYPNQI